MLKSVSERPRLRPGNGRDELRRRDSLRRVRIIPRLSVVVTGDVLSAMAEVCVAVPIHL